MELSTLLLRIRSRRVWADPVRKVRTLEGFSQTETDGGRDIKATARRVRDPKLHSHFQRHAAEELHHGDLFRRRAAELRAQLPETGPRRAESDRLYDLSRDHPEGETDAHGFFTADVFDDHGEVAYVAMLHIAEKRAASLFRVHRDLNRHDPATCEIFEEILRDELYHVSYTGMFLKEWRKAGRSHDVREALRLARGSRFWGAWKRAGARAGAAFGHVVMLVAYFTVVVPFGLLSRRTTTRAGWQERLRAAGDDPSRSQYA